jgi:hypothetical protein
MIRHIIRPLVGFGIVAAIMHEMGVDAHKLGLVWICTSVIYLYPFNKFGTSTALPDPAGH